jgi:hypothetical protein
VLAKVAKRVDDVPLGHRSASVAMRSHVPAKCADWRLMSPSFLLCGKMGGLAHTNAMQGVRGAHERLDGDIAITATKPAMQREHAGLVRRIDFLRGCWFVCGVN